MPDFPLAAHTFDFARVYLSQRDLAPPGSGVWSNPTLIFDETQNPSFSQADTFSAGALSATPRGIICHTSGGLAFLGAGLPASPIAISFSGQAGAPFSADYWDISQGAWTQDGALYAMVENGSGGSVRIDVIESTDSGVTWTAPDVANRIDIKDNALSVQRVDNKIYYFAQDRGTNNWGIYSFTMGASPHFDGLLTPDFARSGMDFSPNNWANTVFIYPNGDFAVVYKASGGIFYRECVSGTWGAEISVPGAFIGNVIIDPSLELLHVFAYSAAPRQSSVIYSTVAHGGTVVPTIATIPAVGTTSDGVGHCSIQGGLIFVPRDDFADFDNAVWVGALPAPSTFVKELLPIPPGESGVLHANSDVSVNNGGSGYALNDTGTLDGLVGFLATYVVLSPSGGIHTSSLNTGGASYVPGDQGHVNGTLPAHYVVDTVDGGGAVLTYHIDFVGGGYSVGTGFTTPSGGAGLGFAINIISVFSGVGQIAISNADDNGGYTASTTVGTAIGGAQPGSGTGLTVNILMVHGKNPSCAYMMYPNGYSLTGPPPPPQPSLACPIVNTGTVGVPFTAQLIATNGTPPYTWSVIS